MTEANDPSIHELGQAVIDPDRPTGEARAVRAQNRTPEEEAALRDFVIDAARLMNDLHCTDIVALDVRGVSQITDYIIIASGTSDRQIRSVADSVAQLARERGLEKFGRDEDGLSTWIVLDLIDVIAHLFEPNMRAHYDLEMMWGDAPTLTWKRPQ